MTTAARPSWTASLAAGLGLLSLLAVLCFHFPDLLTSRELRAIYTEQFARSLLLAPHEVPARFWPQLASPFLSSSPPRDG